MGGGGERGWGGGGEGKLKINRFVKIDIITICYVVVAMID